MVLLQTTTERVAGLVAQLGGLGMLAATLAAVAAVVHRWYVREAMPRALALLVGLSGVAIYLNTTTALGAVIDGGAAPTETQVALFNITAFVVGAGGAALGRRVGDRFGTDVLLGEGLTEVESDVGRLVQSVGRVVVVELPADIEDVVGYDPVAEETKEELAGKRFVFPRRLTVVELRERLVGRLKSDYGVGHVDVELADDGTVEYLALGSRAAGIGPTLPPATNAVAVRADPAFAASAGDLVQVWETDPMRRVLTAELRGVAEDTVTIAIDAADTQKVDPTTEYRLVTLPVEDRPDREFASLLRAADETFSSVTVEAGSPLHGLPVAALALTVVALKPDDQQPQALPDPSTVLAPGDVVFAIARPDRLRRLETATKPLDPSLVSDPVPQRRQRPSAQADDGTAATGADADPAAETEADAPTESEVPSAPDDASPTAASAEPATAESDEEPAAGETEPLVEESDTPTDDGSDGPAGDSEDGPADGSGPEPATADDSAGDDAEQSVSADEAGASSFQDLKEDFESGDADWAETDENGDDQESEDTEIAFQNDSVEELDVGEESTASEPDGDLDGLDIDDGPDADPAPDDGDGLGGDDGDDELEELGFDDDDEDDGLDDLSFDEGEDDGLEGLSFDEDEGDDDLASLDVDDDGDEGLSLDDEDDGEDDSDEEEADEEEDDEDEDDGGSGGGASSFQQLKEEFESGEADWEDDISDSPGGDMRLDE